MISVVIVRPTFAPGSVIDPRVEGNCSGHSATSVQQQQEGPRPTRPMLTRAYPPKGGGAKPPVLGSLFQDSGAAGRADPTPQGPSRKPQHLAPGPVVTATHSVAAQHCVVGYNDSLRRVALFAVGGKPCVDAAACGRIRGNQSNVSDRVAPGVHAFCRLLLHPRLRKPLRSFRREYGAHDIGIATDHDRGREIRTTSARPSTIATATCSNSRSSTSRAGSASISRPACWLARRRAPTLASIPGIKIKVNDGTCGTLARHLRDHCDRGGNVDQRQLGADDQRTSPTTSAVVNQSYAFQPTASDANGDTAHVHDQEQAGLGCVQLDDRAFVGNSVVSEHRIVCEHHDQRERRQGLVVACGIHHQRRQRRQGW